MIWITNIKAFICTAQSGWIMVKANTRPTKKKDSKFWLVNKTPFLCSWCCQHNVSDETLQSSLGIQYLGYLWYDIIFDSWCQSFSKLPQISWNWESTGFKDTPQFWPARKYVKSTVTSLIPAIHTFKQVVPFRNWLCHSANDIDNSGLLVGWNSWLVNLPLVITV